LRNPAASSAPRSGRRGSGRGESRGREAQAVLEEARQHGRAEQQRLERVRPAARPSPAARRAAEGAPDHEASAHRRRHPPPRRGGRRGPGDDARLAALALQAFSGLGPGREQGAHRAHSHDSSPPFAPPMSDTNSSPGCPSRRAARAAPRACRGRAAGPRRGWPPGAQLLDDLEDVGGQDQRHAPPAEPSRICRMVRLVTGVDALERLVEEHKPRPWTRRR